MYSAATTTQFSDAVLNKSITATFRQTIDASEKLYKQLGFEERTTDQPFNEFTEFSGLGLPSRREELQQAGFDSVKQGYTVRLNQVSYGLNMAVSNEAMMFKQIEEAIQGSKSIADALATGVELMAADVFGNAFSTTVGLLPDGQPICSASHKTPRGNTFSTSLGSASFSETGIETMLITAAKMPASNGIPSKVKVKKLVGPVDYIFLAKRLLKSELQASTANNAINAIKGENLEFVSNRYLPSSSNWFGTTDVDLGLAIIWAMKPRVKQVGMDLNEARVFSGNMMFAMGCLGNSRCLLGSNI